MHDRMPYSTHSPISHGCLDVELQAYHASLLHDWQRLTKQNSPIGLAINQSGSAFVAGLGEPLVKNVQFDNEGEDSKPTPLTNVAGLKLNSKLQHN